jgi:anhydro-N-acetylmuramic acid kinase
VIVAGLISGTSVDALDVAVADLTLADGVITLRPLGAQEHPWPSDLRTRLLALLPPAATTAGEICDLDQAVGQATAEAAVAALARFADGRGDLIASHGQTVFHRVVDGHARGTLQLGQPAWVVEATGLPVVSDLRARDIAAGGEGAPLASTLDALWLGGGPPRAALNLGGIANVTVLDGESVLAFDTGPASCLLDAAAQRRTGEPCDRDGRLALAGPRRRAAVGAPARRALLRQGRAQVDRPRAVHHRVRGRTGRRRRRSVGHAHRAHRRHRRGRVQALRPHRGRRLRRRGAQPGAAGRAAPQAGPHTAGHHRRARPARRRQGGLPRRAAGLPDLAPAAGRGARRHRFVRAAVLGRLSPGDAPLHLPAPGPPPRLLVVTPP